MRQVQVLAAARIMVGCAALSVAGPVSGRAADAQAPAAVSFSDFVAGLETTANASVMARPEARVANAANLDAMRTHLKKLYVGLDVKESYSLDGQVFDCIRYDQQPAVRLQHIAAIANPPPMAPEEAFRGAAGTAADKKSHAATFSNVKCTAGTFPIARITLADMSRFGSLHDFFAKGPGSAGQAPAPTSIVAPAVASHKYAYAYQYVTNYGSYAGEAIYSPYVNTGLGEIFSLQQQWTIATGSAGTQTAEIGWQVYPALYGTTKPTLFAYYTGDNYNHTGCYNYSCGAFVQYSGSTIYLQTSVGPVSVVGGAQYYLSNGYYLYSGNWWLAVQGQWVGYYPGSLYNVGGSGGLRTASTLWEVGTESVGTTIWPAEGSGQFASHAYPNASFFRNLVWRDSGNGGHNPALTVVKPSPHCYSITPQAYGGTSWQYYLYIGGPGGTAC